MQVERLLTRQQVTDWLSVFVELPKMTHMNVNTSEARIAVSEDEFIACLESPRVTTYLSDKRTMHVRVGMWFVTVDIKY